MARKGGILQRISHYSIANIVIMAAGLISFPILTRVLTKAEYGIMGAIISILNLTIGLAKMGLGTTVTVRLWPEWEKQEGGKQRYILTGLLVVVVLSALMVALLAGCSLALAPWIGERLAFFVLLASPLVLLRALANYGWALLQAREWSKPRALFEVANAYAAMILSVLGAAVIFGNLRGYYYGVLIGEALVLAGLLVYVLRDTRFRASNISRPLLREMLALGFPFVIYELSGVLFFTGDRFIILWLLDEASLGQYTVAFNLARYVNLVFTFPVMMAVGPAATRLYENEGPEATSAFMGTATRYFLLFALAAVAGMVAIRQDLLTLLASAKFSDAAPLLPVLLGGLLLGAGRDIFGIGLYLEKRPWVMAGLNIIGAAVNAALNIVLIPLIGVMGAATATLATQATMTVVFWILGSRLVRVPVALLPLLKHLLCAGAMLAVILQLDPGPGALRLLLQLGAGVVVYAGLLLALDGEARALVRRILERLRGG